MLKKFYDDLDRWYARGQLQDVEEFLRSHTRQDIPLPVRIAACNELGSFCRGTSRFEQSVSAFTRAAQLVARERGEQSVEYATVVNNLAGTFRLMGEYPRAIALFGMAGERYRRAGAEGSFPYASVLNNLALVYRETGQLQQAISCLEQALELVREMPRRRQELAVTYNNLAALYQAAGDNTRAREHIRCAMEVFRSCSEEENVHYAAGLNALAGLVFDDGDYLQAAQLYEEAARYTKKFFGENLEYAAALRNQGLCCGHMEEYEQQRICLEQAMQVMLRLLPREDGRIAALQEELDKLQKEGRT